MGAAALSAAQSEGPAGYLGAPAAAAAGAAATAAAAGMPPAGVGSLAQSLAAGSFQSSSLGGAPTTAPSDFWLSRALAFSASRASRSWSRKKNRSGITSQSISLEMVPLSLRTSRARNHHMSPMEAWDLLLHGMTMSINLVGESTLQNPMMGMLA